MCRLMAYYGDTALLARTVVWPDRSIIRQSYDARERRLDPSLPAHLGHGNLNADGFGIGWYSERPACAARAARGATEDFAAACTYKSITPAWNNDNLLRLASKICSPLMFAHVRAAYPGMPVSEQNVRAACLERKRLRAYAPLPAARARSRPRDTL
jgi:glutamine amidotransferase